jgi:AraC-like DNA-binding protein
MHQPHIATHDVVTMVNTVRAALDTDLDAARQCLDQISAALCTASMPDTRPALRLVRHDGPIKGGLASWQIRKIDDHIAAHLASTIGIADLSDITRLSSGHFCRAFKISMGITPHTYVRRKRIERAQGMMLNSAASLSEIAGECGLSDQSHLTRLFRKYVGQTPMTWRRAWKPVA